MAMKIYALRRACGGSHAAMKSWLLVFDSNVMSMIMRMVTGLSSASKHAAMRLQIVNIFLFISA